MRRDDRSYLLAVSMFKLALGAIFLLVGWESLAFAGREVLTIAVATGLSFLPAAFAKPLFTRYAAAEPTKVLAAFLALAAAFVASLPYLKPLSPWLLGGVYFVTWIFFFVLEAGFERWFMTLAAAGGPDVAQRLSSVSTGVIQVSVICGPLVIAFVKSLPVAPAVPFFVIALALAAGAAVSGAARPEPAAAKAAAKAGARPRGAWLSVVALASIWPTIAIFNMVVPIIAKRYLARGIDSAAWLEFAFGGSMAVIGFTLVALRRRFGARRIAQVLAVAATIGCLAFALGFRVEAIILAATCLIGVCYGFARIEVRAALSRRYAAADAATIIASANALSAPLVVGAVLVAYAEFSLRAGESARVSWTLPIAFAVSIALLSLAARETRRVAAEARP
jgi:hypothetical protein